MNTITSRAQRPTIFGAVLALFFSLVLIAAPAQAATTVSLSAVDTTVTVGDTITLNWTSTEANQLTASGDWSGDKTVPAGTEDIPATAEGTFTYNLLATDINGRETAATPVTVTVAAAPLPEVTPLPVTFPDACTVVVPATEGVVYSVTIDGETLPVDADTYDGSDFFGNSPAVFTAAADAEHVIAPGAVTEWTYEPTEECFGGDDLVTAKASCSAVTITNISDVSLIVLYGDANNQDADGQFSLAAGASKKVKTPRSTLTYVAFTQDDDMFQVDEIKVPQNCGQDVGAAHPHVKWPHPTTAPAAGVTGDEGGSSVPLLALLGVVSLIAVRRAYALGR